MLGDALPDAAAEDSCSILPLLLEQAHKTPLRETMIHHAVNGTFDLWAKPDNPGRQLYNLRDDLEESRNVAAEYPELVQ